MNKRQWKKYYKNSTFGDGKTFEAMIKVRGGRPGLYAISWKLVSDDPDNIEYFRGKLFNALDIPKEYL
jgi:hypothetical protein